MTYEAFQFYGEYAVRVILYILITIIFIAGWTRVTRPIQLDSSHAVVWFQLINLLCGTIMSVGAIIAFVLMRN